MLHVLPRPKSLKASPPKLANRFSKGMPSLQIPPTNMVTWNMASWKTVFLCVSRWKSAWKTVVLYKPGFLLFSSTNRWLSTSMIIFSKALRRFSTHPAAARLLHPATHPAAAVAEGVATGHRGVPGLRGWRFRCHWAPSWALELNGTHALYGAAI